MVFVFAVAVCLALFARFGYPQPQTLSFPFNGTHYKSKNVAMAAGDCMYCRVNSILSIRVSCCKDIQLKLIHIIFHLSGSPNKLAAAAAFPAAMIEHLRKEALPKKIPETSIEITNNRLGENLLSGF